jgi:hypothetical protein
MALVPSYARARPTAESFLYTSIAFFILPPNPNIYGDGKTRIG